MVDEIESDLKQPEGGIAQYLTIPKEMVWDSAYPFVKKNPLQKVRIRIDTERNVLIVEPSGINKV